MEASIFSKALADYDLWRREIVDLIEQVGTFSQQIDVLPSGLMLRLESLAHEILTDSLRISFYGEFARGKSELINALFFSDVGGRFMPSGVGQTTMCPVEVRAQAPDQEPCIDLLPIQSLTLRNSLESLKLDPKVWQRIPLPVKDPVARDAALQHLKESICVPLQDARRFGLCPLIDPAQPQVSHCPACGEGKVLISRWRYAIVRLHHPVTDRGVVILDTPGFNSLGSEADLGLDAGQVADALIFVLSVDTGVSQSDLRIWEQYLGRHPSKNHLVVLNKVDMLWDDLTPLEARREALERQLTEAGRRLALRREQILAVSARQGLLGRVRGDPQLARAGGMDALERAIAQVLIPGKRQLVEGGAGRVLKRVLMEQQFVLEEQLGEIRRESEGMARLESQTGEQMAALLDRQDALIKDLTAETLTFRDEQSRWHQQVEEILAGALDLERLAELAKRIQTDIQEVWTTPSIFHRFTQFFQETIQQFDVAAGQAQVLAQTIAERYQRLERHFALPKIDAVPHLLLPKRAELVNLAEVYAYLEKRLEIAAYPQGVVARKAFPSLVRQVELFIRETRDGLLTWVEDVSQIMNRHLDICNSRAEEKLQALQAILQSSSNVSKRLMVLRSREDERVAQLTELRRYQLDLARYFHWDINSFRQMASGDF